MEEIKNSLRIGAGFIFLTLGGIGLFLPVWPTTPFVLLAFACFSCSPELQEKILKIRFFREHIENYQTRQGLSTRTTAISLGYLWGMMILSIIIVSMLWLTIVLTVIGIMVTIHILHMAKRRPLKELSE